MFKVLHMPHVSLLLALLLSLAIFPAAAVAQTDQEKLVAAAEKTFGDFMRDSDMTWIQRNNANNPHAAKLLEAVAAAARKK